MNRRTALALALSLGAALPAWADRPLTVQTVTARFAPLTLEFELSGTIEATENVPVSFRNGGRVISVAVQVGDHVTAGQVLSEIEPTQAEAAARAAEAQLAAAEASLNQAQLARDRAASLAERGAGTRADLDAATQAQLAAQSVRDQAEAQLAKARQAVADTVIHAPAPGIVTERSAEPGQIVGAAQTVLTLARDGLREAVFHAPDVAELDSFLGKTLPLRTLDGPEQTFAATISEISPLADEASGTVTVKARLNEATDRPGLGTAVSGFFEMSDAVTISLPWSALATKADAPAVWVVDPDSHAVQLTPVEILTYTSATIELSGGLPEGATVVAAGSHLLYPGRIVTPAGEAQ
ncbi:MAG: efflux RND transporter periplasmic adaptor subunit [Pseudodonghicola sp.]